MKRRSSKKKISGKKKPQAVSPTPGDALSLHSQLESLKKQVEQLNQFSESAEERLQDIEIHVNLLTRLLTTLCIEKFGMRVGVLKRIIKRIEKEAIRDSQIMHLESIYNLPVKGEKKNQSQSPSKNDPWEEIS